MISMQIQNAQAVEAALKKFESKISKKIVREAVKDAWTPLLKLSKSNARNLSGTRRKGVKKVTRIGPRIAKALKLKPFRKQRPGQYGMYVAIDPNQADQFIVISKSGQRNYIPAAIEYGHAFPGRGQGPGGHAPKDVEAKPFMRPALDATLPKAPAIFKTHLMRAIREENMKR